jgi:hypothetical protein
LAAVFWMLMLAETSSKNPGAKLHEGRQTLQPELRLSDATAVAAVGPLTAA